MIVKANDVSVIYRVKRKKKICALDGFNVELKGGEIFGLLGQNGAGKSTAMYCFLGLIQPDKGTVEVFGNRPVPGHSIFSRIAFVPEEPHYHLYLTVEEAIRFYARLQDKNIQKSKISQAIDRLGLGEFRDLRLDKCSKGMKQKIGLATCLLNDPELVFLDEPTRGLDPVTVREFRDIILEMNRRGTTFVINSHILAEVEMICTHVAIIDHGKVIACDRMENMLKSALDKYELEFETDNILPQFLENVQKEDHLVKAVMDVQFLQDFLAYVQTNKIKLRECSLKRLSLEDAFFNILKEKKNG